MRLILVFVAACSIFTDGIQPSLSRRHFAGTLSSAYLLTYNNNNQESAILKTEDNEIHFYGELTQETCFYLTDRIQQMDRYLTRHLLIKDQSDLDESHDKDSEAVIHLHLQSYGGSLMHSLYVADVVQNTSIPVYTYVDGFAASAATLISISGARRFMSPHSLMLIHQLSSASAGKYYEMEDQAENLENLMEMMRNYYLQNTHFNEEELTSLMKRDIWLDANTCLKYGLVDEIY